MVIFFYFKLYKKTGNELCIVVTNVNHMVEEYCHVKTTPDMPIRLAVRMSMSIPGDVIIFDYYIYRMTNLINDSAKSNSSICLNGQNKLKKSVFYFSSPFFPQKLHGSKAYLSIARWQHDFVVSSALNFNFIYAFIGNCYFLRNVPSNKIHTKRRNKYIRGWGINM